MTVIVTGSTGLVGSETVRFMAKKGAEIVGIDNDMRKYFFGQDASTDWNRKMLEESVDTYKHYNTDIRDENKINKIFNVPNFELRESVLTKQGPEYTILQTFDL